MFYLNRNGETLGPYSLAEVRQRLVRGEIAPEDYCWTEGMPDWVPLAESEPFRDRNVPAKAAPPIVGPQRASRRLSSMRRKPSGFRESMIALPALPETDPRPARVWLRPEMRARLLLIGGALLALYFLFFFRTRLDLPANETAGVEIILGRPAASARTPDRIAGIFLGLALAAAGGVLLAKPRRATAR